MMMKNKAILVRITPEKISELKKYAHLNEMQMSEVLRKLVTEYIEKQRKKFSKKA